MFCVDFVLEYTNTLLYYVRCYFELQITDLLLVINVTVFPLFFPSSSGLSVLHELRDGPEGQRFGRGQLLHLQTVHAQKDGTDLRRQDRQQEVLCHVFFVSQDSDVCSIMLFLKTFDFHNISHDLLVWH